MHNNLQNVHILYFLISLASRLASINYNLTFSRPLLYLTREIAQCVGVFRFVWYKCPFFATQSGMAQEMDEGIEWNANSGDMLHRVHKNDIHLTFHINVYVFIGAFNVYV